MADVAARLRDDGLRFRIHVLGDGDLVDDLGQRVRAKGLEGTVILHGECMDVARWYASGDVVLLTSAFEGIPYVGFEAMAMATAVVAPALPGLDELITPDTGILVSPRDDPGSYASALHALADDPARRRAMGNAARARVRAEFTLERMGAEHGALYEELLATSRRPARPPAPESDVDEIANPPAAGLRNRPPRTEPLVSVIVPCFNHGHYLHECLESIENQSYEAIETFVVDNGSTDPDTIDAIAKLEREGRATTLRIPVNRGPSQARNAGIERARGRYILPVDADNILLPGAVAALVTQLRSAGERTAFVYPNYQFFGNRTDYFEPPSYNLHALLGANYCDTSSLIDREVFDRGFRYPQDIVLGYEDWDLLLTLAEHGIYGEPARVKTLLYRKHGFTRADLVEAASVPFRDVAAARHPRLFRRPEEVKGQWAPALTLIGVDPLMDDKHDAVRGLVTGASQQTCSDFEVVVRSERELWPTALGRRLRRVPSAIAQSRAQAVAQGVQIARGRHVLAMYGSPAALLADRGLVEKILRILVTNPSVGALALAQSDHGVSALSLLGSDGVKAAQLSALCWMTTGPDAPPASLELAGDLPLETLARWLGVHAKVQWRHVHRRDRRAVASRVDGPAARLGAPRLDRARDARFREAPFALPDAPKGVAPRIRWPNVWGPPQSRLLCRHLHHESGRYVTTNDAVSPPGCSLQYTLGWLRGLPLAGTKSLINREAEGTFSVDESTDLDAPELLGFIEQAPLPALRPPAGRSPPRERAVGADRRIGGPAPTRDR